MSAPTDLLTPPPAAPATPARPLMPNRRNRDALGLLWVHGSLQVTLFHRHLANKTWIAPAPVLTLDEFEVSLDEAISELNFSGLEVFLILEHPQFVHQAEHAPGFSESATRNYLRARVQRYEKENEPVLWVSQRTVSARHEPAFLLHLLPTDFYARLNGLLRTRALDLTRILPLAVPLQLILEKRRAPADQPVLLAAQVGAATTVLVAQPNSPLYFARTMQAQWDTDSARVAIEINRSLLYAKQQFGVTVSHLWLLGESLDQASQEVRERCGPEKTITNHSVSPLDLLQAADRLSLKHPVNLVAGYIGRKRRRQFFRHLVVATCWLGLVIFALNIWLSIQNSRAEVNRLQGLQAAEATLTAKRDELLIRNASTERKKELVHEVLEGRISPVPAQFLALLGGSLPPDSYLSDYQVKWNENTASWTFRLEGQIDGDEESVRDLLTTWQKSLGKTPLRVRFNDGTRTIAPIPQTNNLAPGSCRFGLEGDLLGI